MIAKIPRRRAIALAVALASLAGYWLARPAPDREPTIQRSTRCYFPPEVQRVDTVPRAIDATPDAGRIPSGWIFEVPMTVKDHP